MEPGAAADFADLELEGAFVGQPIDVAEFHTGFGVGGQAEPDGWSGLDGEPEFLAEFPDHAAVVGFAVIQVPGCGRVPDTGPHVLGEGTLLEEDLTQVIEDERVGGAMSKAKTMDLGTAFLTDDLVLFIHDVEDLFGVCHVLVRLCEAVGVGQMVGRWVAVRYRGGEDWRLGSERCWKRYNWAKSDGMDQLRNEGPLLQGKPLAVRRPNRIQVHARLFLLRSVLVGDDPRGAGGALGADAFVVVLCPIFAGGFGK